MFSNSTNCSLKNHKCLLLIFFLITSRSFLNQSVAVVIAVFSYSAFSFSPVIHFSTVTSTTATKTRSENQYGGAGRLSAKLVQSDTLIIMFCGVRCYLSSPGRFLIHDLQLWHLSPGFEPHSETLLVPVGTGLARSMKQNSAVTL